MHVTVSKTHFSDQNVILQLLILQGAFLKKNINNYYLNYSGDYSIFITRVKYLHVAYLNFLGIKMHIIVKGNYYDFSFTFLILRSDMFSATI